MPDTNLTPETLLFFAQHEAALPLYEAFAAKVCAAVGDVRIRVQKTQIAFSNRHNFAFVSFLPVRKAKERPVAYITVTFGLSYRLTSPRIDAATEPYPNRWTHHIPVTAEEQLDEELLGWLREAWAFSEQKR